MNQQRGQLIPLWTIAVFAMAAFTFFLLNTAYVMEWRVRAQSAAEASARGALSAQVQRYNAIEMLLFASSVEEIRLRHLVGDMTLLARRSGDCTTSITADLTCPEIYNRVRPALIASLDRYTDDVKLMGQLTSAKYPQMQNSALQFIAALNNGSIGGQDTRFAYTLLHYGPRVDPQRGAFGTAQDALALVPGAMGGTQMARQGASTNAYWAPPQDEVLTCASVPPLINLNFWGYNVKMPSVRVYGRAAATAAPAMNEWLSPAMISLNAPFNSSIDQTALLPAESYDAVGFDAGVGGYDQGPASKGRPSYQNDGWYDLTYDDYAATPNSANHSGNGATQLPIQGHTFIMAINWWNTTPIATYLGRIQPNSAACGG